MSIFESYSILCELLPMYDYIAHWCWLMNQLSKKTRLIWKDYALAFKHLDRAAMTVMRYENEFDDQIANLLVRSSILSYASFNIWLNSDESFDRFVTMLGKFRDDKVVWFEHWGHKTNKYVNFISELVWLIILLIESAKYGSKCNWRAQSKIWRINFLH